MEFKESKHPRDKDGKFTDGKSQSENKTAEDIAKNIFPHLTKNKSIGIMKKLSYSGKTSPKLEKEFETSLSKIPIRHRSLAETRIKEIVIIDAAGESYYDTRNETIYMSRFADPDDIIHEYAHALGSDLGSYQDPEFRRIMRSGLENITVSDVIYDENTFSEPIYRIECEKFVNEYQGRLYEEVGIYSGKGVLLDGMLEYLSVGYEEYVRNPENLRKIDPELFYYLEGIR